MSKLSNERVREILQHATQKAIYGTHASAVIAPLAQEVIDLRQSVSLLEGAIADKDRQINDFIEWLKTDRSARIREMAEGVRK